MALNRWKTHGCASTTARLGLPADSFLQTQARAPGRRRWPCERLVLPMYAKELAEQGSPGLYQAEFQAFEDSFL